MKSVIFIGSRSAVLKSLMHIKELDIKMVFIQRDSWLDNNYEKEFSNTDIQHDFFDVRDKEKIIKKLSKMDYDILISNGCPIILPISQIKRNNQFFINIHPTLLPDLKGKTPLNGVFLTDRKYIGATMHFMDDGIDTGSIIHKEKVFLSDDIDQGLVYKISFDLEQEAFDKGIKKIIKSQYKFEGDPQVSEGSYFNRTPELQQINLQKDNTDLIIKKIKSFGIIGQGCKLSLLNKDLVVYSAQKIINHYLLNKYSNNLLGEIVLEYDNKFIFKTNDGLIKIISFQYIGKTA